MIDWGSFAAGAFVIVCFLAIDGYPILVARSFRKRNK